MVPVPGDGRDCARAIAPRGRILAGIVRRPPYPIVRPRGGPLVPVAGLALALLLGAAPVRADDGASSAWIGVVGLDPLDPAHRQAARVAPFAGSGRLGVLAAPVSWGRIEPAPPVNGVRTYRFDELDDAILTWQLAGLDPVLVLTPESPWAGSSRDDSAWVRALAQAIPAAEMPAAMREATGATPPKSDQWGAWARFVRAVVERYDGDGLDDMPALRSGIRHVQILDRADVPGAWLGSIDQYLRLLHAAGVAAREACSAMRIVAGTVDVNGLGHAPHPDVAEWERRAKATLPIAPKRARFIAERGHELLGRLLDLPRVFDVLPQRGAAHIEDDLSNLRFLRRRLDDGGATDAAIWLVGGPAEKLGEPRIPIGRAPDAAERQRRARLLRAARDPRHLDHDGALAWLRRGQAYDLVRTVLRARAAGADAVYLPAALDVSDHEAMAHPAGCPRSGAVQPTTDGGRRTPIWYAMRQLAGHLEGHRVVQERPAAGSGHLMLLTYPSAPSRAWAAVLLHDSEKIWSDVGDAITSEAIALTLPDGSYRLEGIALTESTPWTQEIRARDQTVTVPRTPAPIWILPLKVDAHPR